MKKNSIIMGIAAVVVLGGAAAWYLMRDNSEPTNSTTSTSQTSDVTTSDETHAAAEFSPMPMNNSDFIATFKVTGKNGKNGTGTYEHSANGDYKISGSSQGQAYEAYFVGGSMISCSSGECIKMPGNLAGPPVDTDSISYNGSSVDAPENKVKYVGTGSCSVGTCDKWEVTDLSKNGKITYYTKGDRMYRMIVESDDGTMDGTYEYKDVSIQAPATVQSYL